MSVGAAAAAPRVFTEEPAPLYRVLRWLSRWALRFSYRDIAFDGTVHVPARGPVLLVVNHPNELPDILLAFAVTPRPIHFVGAIAHARTGYARWVLERIGAVFVVRPHEAADARQAGADAARANREAMDRMLAVLRAGGVLAIFPEGGVRRETPIGRLQPGAATLALRAVREAGLADLLVVPVGLGYDAPDRLRSVARVTVGAPLRMGTWCADREAPAGAGAQRAEVAALLGEMSGALAAAARASRAAALDAPAPVPRPAAWLLAWSPVALWGALTHAPAFAGVRALAVRTMAADTDFMGRVAVPGVFVMLAWYLLLAAGALVAVGGGAIPFPLAVGLAVTLPHAGWLWLAWRDAWRARRIA